MLAIVRLLPALAICLLPMGAVGKDKESQCGQSKNSCYKLGITGWRVAAPAGFRLVHNFNQPHFTNGYISWEKEIPVRSPLGIERLKVLITVSYDYGDPLAIRQKVLPACGPGSLYGLVEGKRFGRPTHSFRCPHNIDVYQLDPPGATIILIYSYGDSTRQAGLKAFLDMKRTLCPINNGVEKPCSKEDRQLKTAPRLR